MWQLTWEGLALIVPRSLCKFLKPRQLSAYLFLDGLKESCVCARVAVLSLCLWRASPLGSLDVWSKGGWWVVAAFSVANVHDPFPTSLEISLKEWLTRDEVQLNNTLGNGGLPCFSGSHPNMVLVFAFSNWLLSKRLRESSRSHPQSGQLAAGPCIMVLDSWGIQPSNYSSKAWMSFSWPGRGPRTLHFACIIT